MSEERLVAHGDRAKALGYGVRVDLQNTAIFTFEFDKMLLL
jgi:hypothetical protein